MNEGVLNMAQGALKHRLNGYERMLAKTRFLAGDKLTVVDMFHLPFGEAMVQVRTVFPTSSTLQRFMFFMLCEYLLLDGRRWLTRTPSMS